MRLGDVAPAMGEWNQKPWDRLLTILKIQAYLYENDDRFFPGWKLDTSWFLCTASWTIQVLVAAGVIASALLLPHEGGYELIPNDNE